MASVLLVEDDSAIAALYALKLRLDGHSVRVAPDSASARDCLRGEPPDVACLDLRLPDGPGDELAGRLAQAGAAVILLTNDDGGLQRPPAGVALALLKARTPPSQLSQAISELVAGR